MKDADGNEVFFKVKKHTRLAKLKKAYADKMGKPENSVRFITSDGNRVDDDDTAETVSIVVPSDYLHCLTNLPSQ